MVMFFWQLPVESEVCHSIRDFHGHLLSCISFFLKSIVACLYVQEFILQKYFMNFAGVSSSHHELTIKMAFFCHPTYVPCFGRLE